MVRFVDYLDSVRAFIAYAKHIKGYADGTLYVYRRHLDRFGQRMGIKNVSDITLAAVEAYITYLVADNAGQDTLFNQVVTIRAYVRFMNRKGALGWSHELIDVPRRKKKPVEALTAYQVQALFDNLQRERDKLMFLIMFSSGVRVSELVGIRVEDIRGTEIRVTGKGGRVRPVYVDDIVARRLHIYMAMRDISSGLIFKTSTGRALGAPAVRYAIRQAASRAGISRRLHPHLLRHTFAIMMLENGADTRTIQVLLGHDQIATTQQYLQLTDPWKKDQYEKHKPKIVLTTPIAYGNVKAQGRKQRLEP